MKIQVQNVFLHQQGAVCLTGHQPKTTKKLTCMSSFDAQPAAPLNAFGSRTLDVRGVLFTLNSHTISAANLAEYTFRS